MIFGKTKLEFKVGIFVFIGLVILIVFVLSLGGFRTWTSGYRINFTFAFANGIKLGAPVRFSGIDVGEVKDIKFVFEPKEQQTKIIINGWIKNGVKIPSDSTVWVNTLGLLGEKYIEIMPGKNYEVLIEPNGYLRGVDPVPMHEVVQVVNNIANNIDNSIERIKNKEGTVGKLLYDDTVYKELEALMTDLRKNPWKIFWKTKEKK
jgi:phospholipid/cholesterol/gamma-HCH transport system substrate-binding protein